MVYYYEFNEFMYQHAKNSPDKIDWEEFAKSRKAFPDYHCMANPYLVRGSDEHLFWESYFNKRFDCKCTFPFIVRLINSLLITGQEPKPYIPKEVK